MRRLGAFLVALLLVAAYAAADRTAIIFIRPESAGPQADIHTYIHPNWVLWPAPIGEEGRNRLLSVASGVDFRGEPEDTEFRHSGEGTPWESVGVASLRERGFFQARADSFGDVRPVAVETSALTVSPAALVMALDEGGYVTPIPFKASFGPNDCLVYGAKGWDDAKDLALRVDRAMVVEYSNLPTGDRWSRMWLYGKWPEGLPQEKGVPGLIHAPTLLRLLLKPDAFIWAAPRSSWTGANRWLEFVRGTGVVVQGLAGALALGAIGLAVFSVSRERRSRTAIIGIRTALLLPSALFAGGNLAHVWGLVAWWPCFLGVLVLEAFLFELATRALKRWLINDLFLIALISLTVTLPTNPLWSFYSPIFGHLEEPLSAQWAGVMAASLAGTVAFGRGVKPWILFGGCGLAMLLAYAIGASRDVVTISLEAAGIALGGGLLGGVNLMVLAFLANDLMFMKHWAWAPAGLVHDYGDIGAVNGAKHFLFFSSLGFTSLSMTTILCSLMADRFFWHQARVVWIRRENRALPWLAAVAGIQGIANPEMLSAAYLILVAAVLTFLYDCLGSV